MTTIARDVTIAHTNGDGLAAGELAGGQLVRATFSFAAHGRGCTSDENGIATAFAGPVPKRGEEEMLCRRLAEESSGVSVVGGRSHIRGNGLSHSLPVAV